MHRYLASHIERDLQRKMVFVGGPRQVGKTTLARSLLPGNKSDPEDTTSPHPAYFNWDLPAARRKILDVELPKNEKLLVLDEIHKYAKWRNLLKGIYDTYKDKYSFLITGSARLDYYRRGGDSLLGRYHYYRLHPLSAGELLANKYEFSIDQLLTRGGFPEPFFAADARDYHRWQRDRLSRVVREDLVDLERVNEISSLQLLVDALPMRVGAPLSVKNLAEDLLVAPKTVSRWIEILENLYVCYRIAPYGAPRIRAVKKEQKLYLWDWSMCTDEGARFENLVASQLLKECHFIEDTEGVEMELRYIRDADKREVDFVVLRNKQPIYGVECKLKDSSISPHLKYFSERTPVPKWYQVHLGDAHYEKDNIEVLPFLTFVKEMGLR